MTVRFDGRDAYSIRLELWQGVRLRATPAGAPWRSPGSAPQLVGTLAAERLESLRDSVRAAVQGSVTECRLATADQA
jgi:hypothetical protein